MEEKLQCKDLRLIFLVHGVCVCGIYRCDQVSLTLIQLKEQNW